LEPEIMRKAFLKSARESLLAMRRQVGEGIENETKSSREGQKDEGMDAYDLASEERDRDISLILSDRDRAKMQAIDEALERITNGAYGICEICELDIAEDRLKALPFTRLCISCQSEQEREAKQQRRMDDDRGYRRFAVGETDEEVG
jgi:DnaK suppressor protein